MSAFTDRLNRAFAIPRERPRHEPYRILRPDVVHDVPGVSSWLRSHEDGGWLQSGQGERDAAARRLLFVVWRLFARHPDVLTERAAIARLDAVTEERRAGL